MPSAELGLYRIFDILPYIATLQSSRECWAIYWFNQLLSSNKRCSSSFPLRRQKNKAWLGASLNICKYRWDYILVIVTISILIVLFATRGLMECEQKQHCPRHKKEEKKMGGDIVVVLLKRGRQLFRRFISFFIRQIIVLLLNEDICDKRVMYGFWRVETLWIQWFNEVENV